MKRLIGSGTALATALAITACGGGGSSGGGSGSAAPASGSDTVSVRQVQGVGRVLVDASGKPIYASDLEAGGRIVCTGPCTAFWQPVSARGGAPTAGAGAGKLGVTHRPDGTTQVTAGGRPLYTFTEDSPGMASGDGFTDAFGGHHFTWHVVRSGAKTANGGRSAGGAATSGDSGGGFGY